VAADARTMPGRSCVLKLPQIGVRQRGRTAWRSSRSIDGETCRLGVSQLAHGHDLDAVRTARAASTRTM
jgi:hypothetical protein